MIKKPMLAHTITDTAAIKYPVMVSVKLDGIRAMVIGGVVYSRSMKPIRSKAVQELFGREELNGLDGELLYGDWNAPNVFNLTTQVVMATELKPEFDKNDIAYAVFDYVPATGEKFQFDARNLAAYAIAINNKQVYHVPQQRVDDERLLLAIENNFLDKGYEGLMVSDPHGDYKQGRSTLKEGTLGKLKRFSDDEAVVTGFQEKMTNTNEAKTNEVGRSQRSQALEGMVGAGTLGAIECECKGIKFTMGSGFDDALRAEVWANKDKYLGKLAKFKHFEIGKKDSYRFPIFLGFRDEDDI